MPKGACSLFYMRWFTTTVLSRSEPESECACYNRPRISTSIMYTKHPIDGDRDNLILTSPLFCQLRPSVVKSAACISFYSVHLSSCRDDRNLILRSPANLILTSPTNLKFIQYRWWISDEPGLILTNSYVRRPRKYIYFHNVHLASNRWHRASPSLLSVRLSVVTGLGVGWPALKHTLSNLFVYQGT